MNRTEARSIFDRERNAFSSIFPWVKKTKFIIADRACVDMGHCGKRDLAYATATPPSVTILCRALALSKNNVIGLIRHELGHVADIFLGSRGSEQRADDIAEYVTGKRIFYDRYDVQTISKGRYPRPKYLHR